MEELQQDIEFERRYVEVLAFVRKQKHASCFELMKEFHVTYAASVQFMDTLDERGIVDVAGDKGPRSLLTEAGKKQKHERQQREREEKKREAERPKPEPVAITPVIAAQPSASSSVQPVRKRTRLRTKS